MTQIINIGDSVEISPRDDKTRQLRVSGTVAEVLTKNMDHPHGVLVKLTSGEIGRVKSGVVSNLTKQAVARPTQGGSGFGQKPSAANLIQAGENHHIEFKRDAFWSIRFNKDDIKNHRPQSKDLHEYGKNVSRIIIAKSIAAMLNASGGSLLIGYKEGKQGEPSEIVGIEREYDKLKDPSTDGYRLSLLNVFKDYLPSSIFNHLDKYIDMSFETIDDKSLCVIHVAKSDKRVFLNLNGSEKFYIRVDASTRELTGEEIVEFCLERFG